MIVSKQIRTARIENKLFAPPSNCSQEGYRSSERELKTDRRDLKGVLKEMEAAHEDFVK